jgi:molybdopterin molybdotransferase
MTSVAAALEQLFGLLDPLGTETVPLARAAGRVLAAPALAERDQPPFAAALMDGYALNGVEADAEAMFRVIGTAAAGHGYPGKVGAGQCVRILTGAPLPAGCTRVIRQEDASRSGDVITLGRDPAAGPFIRPAGADFSAGQGLEAPRCLSARDVGLLAAMNVPTVTVTRRPVVALIATGDELVMPGENPGPDQIVASNPFALKPAVEAAGGVARLLPIGRDDEAALRMVFELAQDADLIVSFGGAALGDFDLVGTATAAMGMDQHFLKVDMQPGKRLMLGALNGTPVIGLPGNPVASLVCGQVFVLPALRALLGLGKAPAPRASAELTEPLGPNGARECYLPAIAGRHGLCPLGPDENGLFAVLSRMNALLVRPAGDGARAEGESVDYLPL